MTFEELHEILDNKDRKLSKAELDEIVFQLKRDCFDEYLKCEYESKEHSFYLGEVNAFQIVLDLLEHLEIKEDGEND